MTIELTGERPVQVVESTAARQGRTFQLPISRGLIVVVAVWLIIVGAGLCALWTYGMTPGSESTLASTWPVESQIPRNGRPTLLLFAHPRCPCTRATLSELARILAVYGDRVDTHVLFIVPGGASESWPATALYAQARRITGVNVHLDEERCEARLFRAGTSGVCHLYDRRGRLVFSGGITASRGHEGFNTGRQAIEGFLKNENVLYTSTPVFGCPLFQPTPGCTEARCSLR